MHDTILLTPIPSVDYSSEGETKSIPEHKKIVGREDSEIGQLREMELDDSVFLPHSGNQSDINVRSSDK